MPAASATPSFVVLREGAGTPCPPGVPLPQREAAPRLVVTTSGSAGLGLRAQALAWAERLGARFTPRNRRALSRLCADESAEEALVVGPDRVVYARPAEGIEYFYHPGMAQPRLRHLERGQRDPMVDALGLQPGWLVLDCTLGRASDAAVAADAVGAEGGVLGIESSRVVALLTAAGLETYAGGSRRLREAMRPIGVIWGDHLEVLGRLPDAAYDVVYFDPLFDRPVEASQAMMALRAVADPRPLRPEALAEAARVARRRVVVKQRRGSRLWAQWPPSRVAGGRNSRVEYGVLEVSAPRGRA